MSTTYSSEFDQMIGKAVVDQGLTTAEEVRQCQDQLKEIRGQDDGQSLSLAEVLIQQGCVTRGQLDRLSPQLEEQRVGHQIPGYKVYKKLGAGAMATVFLAKQLSLDRMVAIKVLPPRSTTNPEFVQRFYAEGRAAAKLNHPNIVTALDVGQANEYHYFVMEYVQGTTVSDDLLKRRRYREKEALAIVIQIAQALDHAHEAGFIHRDVKPKNIMLTEDGVAKLADMGLARAISDREAAEAEQGRAFGTPYYISPEQIRGEMNVNARADIYCLGATAYHMVTGRVPFEGSTPAAVMHQHLKATAVPPDHVNPDLSAGISEIIEVCLAKDPNQRYNSAADLLEDLHAVARGEPPMQARRKFDLASLASLDSIDSVDPANNAGKLSKAEGIATHLFRQPLFWVAVSGWGVAIILLLSWLTTAG